ERILRVLSDNAPLPPPRGTLPSFDSAARTSDPSGPKGPSSGSGSVKITRGGVDSTTAMASTLAQDDSASENRPLTQRNAAAARRSGVPLVLGGSIGIVLLGTAVVLLMRPGASTTDTKTAAPAPSAMITSAPATVESQAAAKPTAVAPPPAASSAPDLA